MEIELPDTDGAQLLASNDEWILLQVDPENDAQNFQSHMLMWLPEEFPNNLLRACQKLTTAKKLIPGIDLQFVDSPSAGFLIMPQKGWSLRKGPEAQNLFDKMMWEIDRVRRM